MDGTLSDTIKFLASAEACRKEEDEACKILEESGLDPILNQQTPKLDPVMNITDKVIEQCQALILFARYNKYMRLAGLAANQLGYSGERVTLNACFINRKGQWTGAINPAIISVEGASRNSIEGCLTWPDRQIRAMRHDSIVVSFTDLCGDSREESVSGFEALVWQHEINHLNGVPERVIDPDKKLKPNSPCYCGSGKKFKKCCGR